MRPEPIEQETLCDGASGCAANRLSALNSPEASFFTAACQRRSEKSPVFSFAFFAVPFVHSHVGRHGSSTSSRRKRCPSSSARPPCACPARNSLRTKYEAG